MKDNNFKKAFASVNSKKGSYAIILCAFAIIICVVLNLIVGKLPSNITKLDVSQINLLDISEQTEKICKNLDMDVNIYLLAQAGNIDSYIQNLLERYADLSSHIKFKTVDYSVNPTFLDKYADYVSSTDEITGNSVIVESEKRVQFLDYFNIYDVKYQYDYYTGSYYYTDVNFKGEEAFTSAIDFVTSDNLPVMYNLGGHGEQAISALMSGYIAKENIDLQSLSLLSLDAVPENCDCLLINAPTSDINDEEFEKIKAYLENGGSMIILTDYNSDRFENISALAEYYGIGLTPGIVLEGDSDYYYINRYWLLPTVGTHDITKPLTDAGKFVLVSISHGMTEIDHRSSVKVTPLLTTSEGAYSKASISDATTYEMEDGDIAGPFILGAAITEDMGEGKQTKIVWFSSSSLLSDDFDSAVSGGNSDIFLNSIGWMCERENSISIRSVSINTKSLTVSASQSALISSVCMIGIPVVILLMGLGVWIVRKKK